MQNGVMEKYNIACLQANTTNDLAANLATVTAMIREAAANGAQWILTPEYTLMMDGSGRVMRDNALPADGGASLVRLRELARDLKVWLLIGSLTLLTGEEGEGADTRIVNRSFLVSDAGVVVASYDKIHMFDVELGGVGGQSYRESSTFRPGERSVLAETPWGVLGMTICYDLRFPYLYRELAHAGAVMLSIPSSFTVPTGKVRDCRNALQIFRLIVGRVVIDVMNVKSVRNFAVVKFPHNAVKANAAPLEIAPATVVPSAVEFLDGLANDGDPHKTSSFERFLAYRHSL